jgi:hypothetical protein
MKRQNSILHKMMLGTFILLAVGIGNAQYGQILDAKIPFDFSVGKQSFPAGNYTLKPALNHTMLLRNQTGVNSWPPSTATMWNPKEQQSRSWFLTDTAGAISWPRSGNKGITPDSK